MPLFPWEIANKVMTLMSNYIELIYVNIIMYAYLKSKAHLVDLLSMQK